MDRKLLCGVVVALALQTIGAARVMCPNDPNCVCGGTLAVELNCNIDGHTVKINLLPNTYINIKCENATSLDYNKLPKCVNRLNTFKSVSFKDCPLPSSSFKDVLTNMGVSKTMALIFQNAKNLSGYFDRKHFAGLQDLTKLLLSINGISHLPDNLFTDINKLTWLNIRSNTINLSEELFKPLERLETLEISHNHMTNISSNLFSHLSYLRKLSLWQSNVTWFSKDLFTGVDVLEELDLSSNGLNELPTSIFKPLRKLKKLTLFSNKFSSLPQNLFKHNEELETVVILNNDAKLQELPKYLFGGMANLKQVYIQRSGLEKLPYDVFANSPQITNISLAYNDLRTLSELIFNDQINLLELDLSHNELSSLEPKIFSSLVRLESLKLDHNKLLKVSGSTFSPLLSLIYLNMENNNLLTISSNLFSNNKQRMSISLAHNYLNFEDNEKINNTWVVILKSPFANTYNLRLLNLSHNKFKSGFEDWWINGHDNLDISHNYIYNLWPGDVNNRSYRNLIKKPMKRVWISKNPLNCECSNYLFIDFLASNYKTQVSDIGQIQCSLWAREACYVRFSVIVSIIVTITILYIIMIVVFVVYRKHICGVFKKNIYTFTESKGKLFNDNKNDDTYTGMLKTDKTALTFVYYDNKGNVAMYIVFDPRDKQFVDELLMPGLTSYGRSQIGFPQPENMINIPTRRDKILNWLAGCTKSVPKPIAIVVFSPNYLMSQYSHVDIKKIHGEISAKEHAVFVFTDIGSENSVYTFLKDQREKKNSVVWNEPNFWEKISDITDVRRIAALHERFEEVLRSEKDGSYKLTSNAYYDTDGRRFLDNHSLFQKNVYNTIEYKV